MERALMVKVYAIDGVTPVIHPDAFVHPAATLIGDVVIGPRVYVAPGASLRGDFGRLVLEEGCNVQDNCVMHGFPDRESVVEADGHIGHGAVLHGCIVRRNALVGMNAVVMDGAEIGEEAMVAAMSFVKAGFAVPRRTLVAGIPARIVRELSDADLAWKAEATREYQELAAACRTRMTEAEPLSEPEPGRKRLQLSKLSPLFVTKGG